MKHCGSPKLRGGGGMGGGAGASVNPIDYSPYYGDSHKRAVCFGSGACNIGLG